MINQVKKCKLCIEGGKEYKEEMMINGLGWQGVKSIWGKLEVAGEMKVEDIEWVREAREDEDIDIFDEILGLQSL